jgi:hypothetical protein
MQNQFRYRFGLSGVLVLVLLCAVAYAEGLDVDGVLSKMRDGTVAQGTAYRFQAEEYLTSSTTNAPENILSQQIRVVSEGGRTRVDTNSSPRSFDKKPDFGVQITEVFDGELYKKLTVYRRSALKLGKSKKLGYISTHDGTKSKIGRFLLGNRYLSADMMEWYDPDVVFDSKKNLYYLETIPENGGHIRISIDPLRGYSIIKSEFFMDNLLKNYRDIKPTKIHGVWVPKTIQTYDVADGKAIQGSMITLTDFELNPKIDSTLFEIEFPDDTGISDQRE